MKQRVVKDLGEVEAGFAGTIVQPALWPEIGISTELEAYVELDGACGYSFVTKRLEFGQGGTAVFGGYYNLFNYGKWRHSCGDMPIELRLDGRGRFSLTIFLANDGQSPKRVFSDMIDIEGQFSVPVDLSEAAVRAVVYFQLTAFSDGEVRDFGWATTAPALRTPDLVLSVTTFKREAAVRSTVERFREFRATSPLADHIKMFVVDNGQSVDVTSSDDITVFPNANLGGAGGFTRGLLEAQKAGFSHCLFMDDDASVHMGAVVRTWMLLAYAIDPATAVAGAMVNADYGWQMWENGASFECGCRAHFHGLDLREQDDVLGMEFATTGPAPHGLYGGWWYFAFPVNGLKRLPFPFFVRGDDVSFSLANDFNIVRLPGVASVQESFVDKGSPQTWYLDFRSHLAHHLSLPHMDRGAGGLNRMILGFYLRNILRFHYDTLSAVNLAFEDVMRGPAFFDDNADMAERRGTIKALTVVEAWQPTDRPAPVRLGKSSRPLRALLLLTLNGHLLPFANKFGTHLTVDAGHREDWRMVYGAREVTFLNASRTAQYTVKRDRKRFWEESLRLLRNTLRFRKEYDRHRDAWQGKYPDMTNQSYWERKLG